MKNRGLVFDIKRFSVHDGPGIRTSVFLKGCSLNCGWCQNPEGKDLEINLWHFQKKCHHCLKCVEICPVDALRSTGPSQIEISRDICTKCGLCVEACPTEAIAFDSKEMSAQEVAEICLRDRDFYEVSGGGVTVTGGDPLVQHEFAVSILSACKSAGLHTVIETCLHGRKKILQSFLPIVDLFITDLKLADADTHSQYTGLGNEVIKENLAFLGESRADILVRIPLIPGITAKDGNIRSIARFVHSLCEDIPIELINYNPLARDKYRIMHRKYVVPQGTEPFSESELEGFQAILHDEGITPHKEV